MNRYAAPHSKLNNSSSMTSRERTRRSLSNRRHGDPVGFHYASYGWTGDVMSDGLLTPGQHDGMGVVVQRRVGAGNDLR